MEATRALVIENGPDDPAGPLGDWLAATGLQLVVVRPYDGDDVPGSIDGYAAVVVLGGPQSAYDDGPIQGRPSWLPAVKSLLRAAVAGATPTLGVCLGGQLLAEATGGLVERAKTGPVVGAALVAKRDAAARDPVFGGLPFTPDVLEWHYDEITELPPGAVLLAASPTCRHEAFRVGAAAWGVQFHIESTPEAVTAWARASRPDLESRGVDVDAVLDHAVAVHAELEQVWRPVAERFAALAMERSEQPPVQQAT